MELSVPRRITVEGTEHFIAKFFIKRSSLVLEGVEARVGASASPRQVLRGGHQLRSNVLATRALVHPESRYIEPVPFGVTKQTADHSPLIARDEPHRLFVRWPEPFFIERAQPADDHGLVGGAHVAVDSQVCHAARSASFTSGVTRQPSACERNAASMIAITDAPCS